MTQPKTAHERLKVATSPLHRVLDHSPALRPLLSNTLSIGEYTEILCLMRQWYALNEIFILQNLSHRTTPSSLDMRCKLQFIDTDLRRLEHSIDPKRAMAPALDISSDYQALGALYVLEGATQGGRFIAKKIENHFKRKDITHFFASYGNALDQRWAEFTDHLNNTLVTEGHIEQAIEGATAVFESMTQWFDTQKSFNQRAIA